MSDFLLKEVATDYIESELEHIGFDKAGCVVYEKEGQFVELRVREIEGYTKAGVLV